MDINDEDTNGPGESMDFGRTHVPFAGVASRWAVSWPIPASALPGARDGRGRSESEIDDRRSVAGSGFHRDFVESRWPNMPATMA